VAPLALWTLLVAPLLAAGEEASPLSEGAAPPEEAAIQAPPGLTPPVLDRFEAAAYPAGLDLGRVEVQLQLLISEQGSVEEVLAADGPAPFATLAAEAARRMTFTPAREGGHPVAVELPFTWVFDTPPVSVEGWLRLHGSRAPGAGIALEFGARRVITDAEGRFTLRNLGPGDYTPTSPDPEVRLDPLPFHLEVDQQLDLNLWADAPWGEGELVGTWQRHRSQVVARALTTREIATTPGTMGDPVRAVLNLPGVARAPLDSGWLLVRGGDPEDVGLYIDGVRVPLVYHLMGLTSVIHPAMVEQVVFQPGGYDARYGRATGGVVDLRTRPVHDQPLEARAGVDLVTGAAFLRAPLGRARKVGIAAAVRHSWLDTLLGAFARAGWFGLEEGAEDIAPRFQDWQIKLDSRPVGLFGFGYQDSLLAPQTDGGDVQLDVGTRRLHGRVTARALGRPLAITPILASDWRRLSYAGYADDRTQLTWGARAELEDEGSGSWGWSTGVDWETGRYRASVITDEHPAGIDVDHGIASVDPYADLRLGQDRSLTLGLRIEDLWVEDQLARIAPSPRATLRQPLGQHLSGVATAGMTHQWPPLDILAALPQGPYLHLEGAAGGSLGLQAAWPGVSLESTAYGRRITEDTLVEDDGTVGQGRGVAWGLENLVKAERGPISGWVAYTWGRSLRQHEPGDSWEPHRFDQPHNLVAVAAWALPADWVVAGRLRASSGFPMEGDARAAYDVLTQQQRCIVDGTTPLVESACPAAGERLPAGLALDLKVMRRFARRGWSGQAYLDVQNVFNRRVAEPVITGNLDLGTLYAFGFPILPIFGVEGAWRR